VATAAMKRARFASAARSLDGFQIGGSALI
jgi:hypothetical protein